MNDPYSAFDYKLLLGSMNAEELQRLFHMMKHIHSNHKGKTHPAVSVCDFEIDSNSFG